jgi:hypothetical protein
VKKVTVTSSLLTHHWVKYIISFFLLMLFSLLQVLISLFLLLIIVQNAILKEMYISGSTLLEGVKGISGLDRHRTVKRSEEVFMQASYSNGDGPYRSVNTRESLPRLTTVNELKNAFTQQMYRSFGCKSMATWKRLECIFSTVL